MSHKYLLLSYAVLVINFILVMEETGDNLVDLILFLQSHVDDMPDSALKEGQVYSASGDIITL